jgi:hypothetical protein
MLNLDRTTTLLVAAVNIHPPTCKYLSRILLPHETHTILSPSHLNTHFQPRFQTQRTPPTWLSSASAPHPKDPQTRRPSSQPTSNRNPPHQRHPSLCPARQQPPNKSANSSCNSSSRSVASVTHMRAASHPNGSSPAARNCAPTVRLGTETSSGAARKASLSSKRSRLSYTSGSWTRERPKSS